MPRQPRLDAPGTLHHVMGRGIETSKIFRTRKDREDFVDRLAELCRSGGWAVYAWRLVDAILTDLDKPDPELDRIWAEEARKRWEGYKSGRIPSLAYHAVMEKY